MTQSKDIIKDSPVGAELRRLRKRFDWLDERLGAWQQQVREEIEKEFARLQESGEIADEVKQQNAARMALARAGDGPRRDLNDAVDELCALYLETSDVRRAAIRQMIQDYPHIFHDLWGYVRRAAEQVRSGGGEQWLRFGLAVVAMEDLMGDWVDTVEGVAELFETASGQGLDIVRNLREVAAMSSAEVYEGRESSTREFLADFNPKKYAVRYE